MTRRYDWKNGCAMLLFLAVTATASTAQGWAPITFTTLFTFDTTDGLSPTAALIQGPDGNSPTSKFPKNCLRKGEDISTRHRVFGFAEELIN